MPVPTPPGDHDKSTGTTATATTASTTARTTTTVRTTTTTTTVTTATTTPRTNGDSRNNDTPRINGTEPRLTIREALDIVRDSEESVDETTAAFLERQLDALWRRLNAQPNSYNFTLEEFSLFNFYRSRFPNSEVARRAIARYWDNLPDPGPNAAPPTPGSSGSSTEHTDSST